MASLIKSGKASQIDVTSTMQYAYENGITMLDSAPSYGNSEEVIGKQLERVIGILLQKPLVLQLKKLKINTLKIWSIHLINQLRKLEGVHYMV